MSTAPLHPAMLSFRLKPMRTDLAQAASSAHQPPSIAKATRESADVRLVDKEKVYQDVSRLATRAHYKHAPEADMDLEEAERLIELEEANAKARSDFFQGKRRNTRSRGRAKGRHVHFEERNDSEAEEDDTHDPIDDLDRLLAASETDADGTSGGMDVEINGMRDILETEVEWRDSSVTKRAALEKAIILAQTQGDYVSRFDPGTYSELAEAQAALFRTAGRGNVSGGVGHRTINEQPGQSMFDMTERGRHSQQAEPVSKGKVWSQGGPGQEQAGHDEEMSDVQEYDMKEQKDVRSGDGDSMEID